MFILLAQRKIIDFLKEMNPEKKGSIYDVKFSKKWEESCDEAEKLAIYKCGYKAYNSVNTACIVLWLFCFIGSSIWNFGIMPVAMVSIIWFVLITSYTLESYKISKRK